MTSTLRAEIAAAAARLIVEEGLDYGAAKRRAAQDLQAPMRRLDMPDNDSVEEEVRSYIDLFHADSQPADLAALRAIAAAWMDRLAPFRPHLTGAVWRGTATRRSDIHLDLYCDDSKAAELALIDARVDYEVSTANGPRDRSLDVLNIFVKSSELDVIVRVAMTVLDYDDLRGALRADARGRRLRGDLAALRALSAAS